LRARRHCLGAARKVIMAQCAGYPKG